MAKDTPLRRSISAGVVTVVLWVLTAVLGLLDILAIRSILVTLYILLGGDTGGHGYWVAVNVSNWSVLVTGLLWIAVTVGGGEFHRKRVGQRSSWIAFAITIAVEAVILILSFVF